jgi:hypothetical protein
MPELVEFGGYAPRPVATEAELLEFVNKARQAGGANVLEALLPSVPENAKSCLIARGLNFSCSVSVDLYWDDDWRWGMMLPDNMPFEQAKAVADALEAPLVGYRYREGYDGEYMKATAETWNDMSERGIVLPQHIGNAADAFDAHLRFQEYAGGI